MQQELNKQLGEAVKRNDKKRVTFLLDQGADADYVAGEGYREGTVLMVACREGHKEVTDVLIKKGAHVNRTDRVGRTALHLTARKGDDAILKILLDNNADVDAVNWYCQTPLHDATLARHDVTARILLEHNSNPDVVDEFNGDTPLHIAANRQHNDLVRVLMDHKANPDIKDKSGKYPHEYLFGELRGRLKAYWDNYRLAPLLRAGKVRPNTVKVYLVGSTGAGKTTFAIAITGQGDQFDVFTRTAGIDILEAKFEDFCQIKVYDVAGHDLYHTTHSFFFGGASALFIYVVDLERSPSQLEDDAIYWLAFVYSGRSHNDSPPHLMILGSRGEKHKTVRQIKLKGLVNKLKEKFEGRFIFHADPHVLDLRQANSSDMDLVKQQLIAGVKRCLKFVPDVPLVCHEVRERILPPLRSKASTEFDLGISSDSHSQVIEKELFRAFLVQKLDALKEGSMFVLLLQHLEECGEIVDVGTRLVISTPWLCRSIIAPVMASKASKDSEEFEIALEAKLDGTATLSEIADALDRFSELNETPSISPLAAIDILCHMNLSFPFREKDVFLFPALIQNDKPDSVWMKEESTSCASQSMVYVGIRLQCESDIEIFTPAAMPLLQCEAVKKGEEMMVILWKGGMLVENVRKVGDPKVEAIVAISDRSRAIRALDLVARAPAYCHQEVKKFLDKLQHITLQILDTKSPGTRVEKRYLSHQHLKQHVENPISYSQKEVDAAKKDNGFLIRTTDIETVLDSVIDLLAVENDHIIYKMRSLGKQCSSHWLALGRTLLSQQGDQIHDLVAGLGETTKPIDKFCFVLETWIRTHWKTATWELFLNACETVEGTLKEQVEIDLGFVKYLSSIETSSTREFEDVTDSPVVQAVLTHGSTRWYAFGLELKFSDDQITAYCNDKVNYSDKLLALLVKKAGQVGIAVLEELILDACRNIASPIIGHVQTALGKFPASRAKRRKLGNQ